MAKVLDSVTLPIDNNGTVTDETYVNNPKSIAPQFDASTAYTAGQFVYYEKKLYRFIADHAAGAWNSAHVEEKTIVAEISALKQDLSQIFFDKSVSTTWFQGYINSSTGAASSSTDSCYSDKIGAGEYTMSVNDGYKIKVAKYSDANAFQGLLVSLSSGSHSFTVPDGYYVRTQVTLENGTISPSTINNSGVSITQKCYTDTTLTQEGKAADAKATGEAVDTLAENVYALTGIDHAYTNTVVSPDMTRSAFVSAFDSALSDYEDLCLCSDKSFAHLNGTHTFEEAYEKMNQIFRYDVYDPNISKDLLYDRINVAFETPIRRFQDAKINDTVPCDFSFQIWSGQGGEPSLIVSADGGELWAYSYGERLKSDDGVTWSEPTVIDRSDKGTSSMPQHIGMSVVDDTIFMFGRDPSGDHNLKMYTSPLSDGINFTYQGIPLAIGHDFGDGLEIDNWGNSFITKVDDTYYLFIEGRQDNDGNFWDIYLVTCTDPFYDNGDGTIGNWQNVSVAPIVVGSEIFPTSASAVACGNPDIAKGSDNRPIRVDGKYFMYFHSTAFSYSYILRAYSYDLIHWTYEGIMYDNRNKPTAGQNQSSNADHALIEFKGRTYLTYTTDINTNLTPHLMCMIDDRPFREILAMRP